jgi:Uma2 family endonuclease
MSFVNGLSIESYFPQAAMPQIPVCRIPVTVYEKLIQAGIIDKDDRIELLDGWIMPRAIPSPRHVVASELTNDALRKIDPAGWCFCTRPPIELAASMPEPDIGVFRGEPERYLEWWPRGKDVGLIVEVADESLSRDQGIKKNIYAQAGIPCYWLINLIDQRIEVYTDPAGSGEAADYRERHDYLPTDEIPLVLDGQQVAAIAVRNLLP